MLIVIVSDDQQVKRAVRPTMRPKIHQHIYIKAVNDLISLYKSYASNICANTHLDKYNL